MHKLQPSYTDAKILVENDGECFFNNKTSYKETFFADASIFSSNTNYGRQEIERLAEKRTNFLK